MPTDGNRTGETTSYNKVYDKVIDTDSTSYIITSNVITSSLKPSCDSYSRKLHISQEAKR